MNALTIAELRCRHASLALEAEQCRNRWRVAPATEPRTLALGKRVKALQARADDYAAVLRVAEGMQP